MEDLGGMARPRVDAEGADGARGGGGGGGLAGDPGGSWQQGAGRIPAGFRRHPGHTAGEDTVDDQLLIDVPHPALLYAHDEHARHLQQHQEQFHQQLHVGPPLPPQQQQQPQLVNLDSGVHELSATGPDHVQEQMKKDAGTDTDTQEAWVAERRRAVAKASKTARQKKKREMADLLEENKRLRIERAEFLAEIEELVAKVQEMREGGDIDTHIENELLKAQLAEYKKFISALQHMAAGIPTNDVTKRKLYEKGADYAISYVLSLLTRSVREKSRWRRADIPAELASMGGQPKLAMWFRHVDDFKPATGQRLQVRVDQLIPGIKPETLADVYWSLWNDQSVTQQFFNFADSKKNWENIKIEHVISESIDRTKKSTKDRPEAGPGPMHASEAPAQSGDTPQLIKVSYTRQFDPDADWVYVSTKTKQDISQAALHLPMGAESSSQEEEEDKRTKLESRAQGAVREGLGHINCATCYILARSTTTHHKMMLPASALEELESTALKEGQTINPFYLESCVVWEAAESSSAGDSPVSRMSVVLSLPETFNQRWLSGSKDIVDPNGKASLQFCKYVRGFSALLAEKLKSYLTQDASCTQTS
ncbi:Hypothetical Protein FCC1311_001952 [Hondaea fermentalgiana]|uniref:BZIP domain-containing protein n=1 Tax=Hondaea fermentalgiana TaxID=2315210 RepID=A0A2R5FYY9_9STRA|nr:Hypothetical Protein FCC1311_001952 [Hondaea fermentalgiana]|eukprot:GBG23976.1 Hypothetical Protein FCC1311_001952 [Hondaea fermentalgiana]